MNKTAIKKFSVWARRKLISDITYKAGLLGITERGILQPLSSSTKELQFFDVGTGKPTEIFGDEISQRDALVKQIREKEITSDYKTAFGFVIEEVAYTWFNRLIAIRFMEVNDYLPSRIRVLSSEIPGKIEPDMVTKPFETDMDYSAYETDKIMQLKDENKLDELFRMLFIKQCNKLNEVLPELFEKTADYTELLLNISFTDTEGIVNHLINDIVENDFTEDVEVIGWMYQYYNTEPKDETFALLKKNIKITKERIPAATQLFTPDWIVKYMVENSLGRLWVEGHPNENLVRGWKYFIKEAEQEESVKEEFEKIKEEYKKITPEEIKIIDPCMGSGHTLIYAFDVLMQIYECAGYVQRDAACSIIENNIFGVELGKRAYQLAYFAIMMKARSYDRRFLTKNIKPNLSYAEEKVEMEFAKKYNSKDILNCLRQLENSDLLGSLTEVGNINYEAVIKEIEAFDVLDFGIEYIMLANENIRIIKNKLMLYKILSQKYHVVVTNPPYMGGSGMTAELSDFVKTKYPDSKSDLFAVFIEKCLEMTKTNFYTSMITQHAFMFLSSFEKLRSKILLNDFVTMAHLGARAFEEIGGEVVQTTAFVLRKSNIRGYKAHYSRLVEYNSQKGKEDAFLAKTNEYIFEKENYSKIPGSPISYWVNKKILEIFEQSPKLESIAQPKGGLSSTNNDRFLRIWHEVNILNINFQCSNEEETYSEEYKWFPFNKGGDFRKWYGNRWFVVNWKNNGEEIKIATKGAKGGRIVNPEYYFKESVSCSAITSKENSFRFYPKGAIFDINFRSLFFSEDDKYCYLGLLNSSVIKYVGSIISATIALNGNDINRFPILDFKSYKPKIKELVEKNIIISKNDWDSFETSWDFKVHPLITYRSSASYAAVSMGHLMYKIKDAFNSWLENSEVQFNILKANEEELNRIFIDIYGLQGELNPEVEDENVTVYKADLQRDIKSLISFAVGCIFGRYSLDIEGLAYAGGEWDNSKYKTFIPDKDNCIPITDEEYFEDDIVGLFIAFIKKVYGEDTLEENLEFIACALGNKGNSSREVIRNYFVKDFYKDHLKIYQKRPIYWLYDSGKYDGFKALIYMHRYNADTTGIVRVDYLHKMQKIYMNEIERMQEMVSNSTNSREVLQAEKRKEKLVKQLKETKEYDEKISHLALSRIVIDLDDGVKVNYEKIQTGQDGKKLDILGKI